MAPGSDTPGSAVASAVVVPNSEDSDTRQGIPQAVFFEDIAGAVKQHGAENLISQLSALASKYRYFESKFAKSKNSLEMKIPDVKRALVAVRSLQRRNQKSAEAGGGAIESHFELSDGLYVRAMIPQTSTVGLWLGASVMVEYTFEEAIELLTKNHEAALTNLKSTEADIAYLRDQINTTDVNLSQVYNYHIKQTKSGAAAATMSPSSK